MNEKEVDKSMGESHSNKSQIRAILGLGLALFLISLLATVLGPMLLLLVEEGEVIFSHLDDLTVFSLTYIVFGTPIFPAGAGAGVLFISTRSRFSLHHRRLLAVIAFIIFSGALTALTIYATRQFMMYFISLL
jgi:hypothetical protein